MSKRNPIEKGQQIERWTVIGAEAVKDNGEVKWLCRCECGTERYVAERSLRYRTSKSCGCFRKEKLQEVLSIADIEGNTYGELTVLYKAETKRKNGGVWWTCRCSCGNLYDVPGSLLITGRRTRCNGSAHEKNYTSVDITGKRFHDLTALYPLKSRDKRSSVMWHCQCDCGNEVDISYNNLVYCNIKSCGCRKKAHEKKLKGYLTHVAGTSLDIIKSEKIPTNNTTGVKGVYYIRNRWVAKIVFQKRAYYLGTYMEYEEAVQARKEAELLIREGTVNHYNKWKILAEADPTWGKENPIAIRIEKREDHRIAITFLPVISE